MDGLWIVGGLTALVAALIWWRLRAGTRLRRRLFLLFVGLSWIPSIAVLLLQARLQGRAHELVNSPGLHRSLESSLTLARRSLQSERHDADSLAAALSREEPVALDSLAAAGWWRRGPRRREHGGRWGELLRETPVSVDRIRPEGTPVLLATSVAAGESLTVAVALDTTLARLLADVERGGAGLRQIDLFYAQLVRVDVVVTSSLIAGLVLLFSLLLSRRLARQIGEPVSELSLATARVAAGDLDARVPAGGVDEIGSLVDSFNRMTTELRRGREALRQAERIAAWQGVARRLAHEIKNPLTPIHLSIHRMRGKTDDPTMRDCLDTVLEETENLRRLADEFSTYGRLPEPNPRPVDPRPHLQRVVELYARAPALRVDWSGWIAHDVVPADEGQLRQVLANLVKNASEAMQRKGTLRLSAARSGGMLAIEIADDGPGLPDPIEQIFEADFTTKPAGTGLGLAISRKIIEDHGGRLTARPGVECGAVLRLELPVAEGEQA